MNGGELFTHLVQRVRFKEQEVTLYSGEIVLALEHLHKVKLQKLHTYFHPSFPLQSDWTLPHFERVVKVVSSFTQEVLLLSPAYSDQFLTHLTRPGRMYLQCSKFLECCVYRKRKRSVFNACLFCAAIIQREESCLGASAGLVEWTLTVRLTLFWFSLIFCHCLLCCHLLFIKVAVHFPGEWLHFMTQTSWGCKLSSWANNFGKDEKKCGK